MAAETRGRPLDAEVGDAALRHALRLLEVHGYDGLRMKDVAAAAGIGLGALYRRWPGKHDLVVAALRATGREHAAATDDALGDLVDGLERLAVAMRGGLGRLIATSLRDPDSDLARVVVEAKLEPMRRITAVRLERIIGAVPDLRSRADLGPALIVFRAAVHGAAPSREEIERDIVPLMTRLP